MWIKIKAIAYLLEFPQFWKLVTVQCFSNLFFFIRQRKTGFINFQFVHSTWPNVSFIENIYGARAYSMNLHFSVHTSLIAHGIRSNWALFSSQRNVLVCIFSSVFFFWIVSSVYWWVRSYAMRTHSFFCARSFHHFWWLQRNEKHIDITAFCYKLEGAYIRNSNKKKRIENDRATSVWNCICIVDHMMIKIYLWKHSNLDYMKYIQSILRLEPFLHIFKCVKWPHTQSHIHTKATHAASALRDHF